MTLVEKWGFVVKGILNHESSTSVFELAKDALAESALGIFTGFGSFVTDVFRLRDDLNVAMRSS